MLLARGVAAELLLLFSQRPHAPFEVAPAPLIFVERDDGPEIGIGESLELLDQVRLAAAQLFTARKQLLRQPRPAMDGKRCSEALADVTAPLRPASAPSARA